MRTSCLPHLRLLSLGGLVFAVTGGASSSAATIYVDNLRGRDQYDGLSPTVVDTRSGPTRSIGRALQIAGPGDTVVIADTGIAYREQVVLFGPRHSGFELVPFRILGNGAVIDGSQAVPPAAWRRAGDDLWTFTPFRKGYYRLLLDGQPVPEHRPQQPTESLPEVPAGHWTAWKGSIYYRSGPGQNPAEQPFRFARLGTGLTLYRVHNVEIRDLTIRGFRADGVNAHGLVREAVLENVASIENGRSGVAVGGTSAVVVRKCHIENNGLHSFLITELGAAKIEDARLDQPPTVRKD